MKATILKFGSSRGLLILEPILAQLGLEDEVELEVRNDALVIRRLRQRRSGWSEASRAVADSGDDALALGEFANNDDAALKW
ncbi:AbrB/MazE/SpoVT family DNA-binding domain-containing protein [Cupriavidus sp. IDO]|uniref:AbrB/MazE/SpoVT family DNA-binding domain-containing protein n=1 Tax=Cupriavidus sp. IDO TaxID=1539142 RepID=UPI0005791E2A|nr:antitoxin [Cupriavidus sp. IDO]KWR91850.1 antitoxin [Cupriavidus sp. IDO]